MYYSFDIFVLLNYFPHNIGPSLCSTNSYSKFLYNIFDILIIKISEKEWK